ncbi:putative transcription factor GRF family [Arabidopsis thaliana]
MSSSSETSVAVGGRGLPLKCICGLGVTIFTSKTQKNHGRPFFGCTSKRDTSSWTNKNDGHLFKWVEEAVYEEVEDALPNLGIMANEIVKSKYEVNELNASIQEFKEDAMWSKMEIRKLKVLVNVCVVWVCLMTIVIAYQMFGKAKETSFVIGKY